MTGAKSLEEKVFTQYLDVVRKQHPGAPVPPLFRDEPLFKSAAAVPAARWATQLLRES